jgi:hypothetical protein
MNEPVAPAALIEAVRRDLKPVRPLASPARRALAVLPIAILLLVGVPEYWSWKSHQVLALRSAWGLSILETLLSLAVLAAAFREAIPGREISKRVLTALFCICGASFLLANATTLSPAGIPPALWLEWFGECIVIAFKFSVPALIIPTWLVSRALPNRPALTGALCGLGVGLMADAGLRLICWDGDYAHVLVAHGGAILILAALGALSATFVERVKARKFDHRSP